MVLQGVYVSIPPTTSESQNFKAWDARASGLTFYNTSSELQCQTLGEQGSVLSHSQLSLSEDDQFNHNEWLYVSVSDDGYPKPLLSLSTVWGVTKADLDADGSLLP